MDNERAREASIALRATADVEEATRVVLDTVDGRLGFDRRRASTDGSTELGASCRRCAGRAPGRV